MRTLSFDLFILANLAALNNCDKNLIGEINPLQKTNNVDLKKITNRSLLHKFFAVK